MFAATVGLALTGLAKSRKKSCAVASPMTVLWGMRAELSLRNDSVCCAAVQFALPWPFEFARRSLRAASGFLVRGRGCSLRAFPLQVRALRFFLIFPTHPCSVWQQGFSLVFPSHVSFCGRGFPAVNREAMYVVQIECNQHVRSAR